MRKPPLPVLLAVGIVFAMLGLVAVAVVFEKDRHARAERERLEYLDVVDRSDKVLGQHSLSPQELEELRQLRERAAKRAIDNVR
jgi:hypothetical protein